MKAARHGGVIAPGRVRTDMAVPMRPSASRMAAQPWSRSRDYTSTATGRDSRHSRKGEGQAGSRARPAAAPIWYSRLLHQERGFAGVLFRFVRLALLKALNLMF